MTEQELERLADRLVGPPGSYERMMRNAGRVLPYGTPMVRMPDGRMREARHGEQTPYFLAAEVRLDDVTDKTRVMVGQKSDAAFYEAWGDLRPQLVVSVPVAFSLVEVSAGGAEAFRRLAESEQDDVQGIVAEKRT
jgi:hypothetical protein